MNGDLISRRALLADIEESVVFSVKNGQPSAEIRGANKITDRIKAAPAVDAVALPCKVGDTVWGIRNYNGVNHPQQGKVDQMYYTNDMRLHIKIKHICIGEWGKKIFLTREEAEAALKRRVDDATD